MLQNLINALGGTRSPKALSLISDIFDYIDEKFFTVDLNEFENINVSSGGLVSIKGIIIGLAIGILVAACSTAFTRRVVGDFVRALTGRGCTDPESALPLSELGYERNTSVRSAIRGNIVLKKYVRIVREVETEGKGKETVGVLLRDAGKIDPSAERFYIEKEESYAAEVRFEKAGTNPVVLVGIIVGVIVAAVLVIRLLPDLLQMVDNFVGNMGGDSLSGTLKPR